jgi:hypothetical protein
MQKEWRCSADTTGHNCTSFARNKLLAGTIRCELGVCYTISNVSNTMKALYNITNIVHGYEPQRK